MNKKKFAILALLMILIIAMTSCLMVACNPNSDDTDGEGTAIEATKDLLINNGDFRVIDTSVKTYPRSVTSWTGAKMYSSSSFRDDVTAGVISLNKALYDENKSRWDGDEHEDLWNKLNADGRYDGDADEIKNALMIYMPVEGKDSDGNKIYGPTAYGYTSASFSLEKGAYYKLTVDVLTYNIGGEDEANRGARIYVSSNTYAEFDGIDTKGEWKTYEIYIESSPVSSTSLTLMLGLGKYSSYFTKGLTSGYAFFDNVSLTKLEEKDNVTPEQTFEAVKNAELDGAEYNNAIVTTSTLKVPNGRFDFGSTTLSTSGTPSSWSLVTGNSGKDDPAPTSLGYNAVIDLSEFDAKYEDWSNTYYTRGINDTSSFEYKPAQSLSTIKQKITALDKGIVGTNVFMLSQQLMTAQGIRSSRTITIEKNKTYAISINLYTYGIHGAGVSLILTGSDGKDIAIKGISSNPDNNFYIGEHSITPSTGLDNANGTTGNSTDGWRTYTFYIQGNQFKDYSYNMAVWLGTDGTSDNVAETYQRFGSTSSSSSNTKSTTYRADGTFSTGWVFIDELNLKTIDKLPEDNTHTDVKIIDKDASKFEFNCATEANGDSFRGIAVDLTSVNMFGDGDDYILNKTQTNSTLANNGEANVNVINGTPDGWVSNFDPTLSTNPIIKDIITEGIVDISDKEAYEKAYKGVYGDYPDMPYELANTKAYMMHASSESYYEAETYPFTIEANHFYRISLWVKTVDVSSSSGAYVYLLDKSEDADDATFTSFTKINTDDMDSYLNDWCELTVVVRGSNDKATKAALKFTLGTGNRWASSTLTSGAMFVANMSMSTISYANFKDTTTGTYTKSVDMSESYTYSFTNGSFDNYDLDDDKLESGTALTEQNAAATPDSWTINDKTIAINGEKVDSDGKKDENGTPTSLFAGVIALNRGDKGKNEDKVTVADKLNFLTSQQAENVTGISYTVFNNFYHQLDNNNKYLNELPQEYLDTLWGPNMLAIGSKYEEGVESKKYAIGFASTSLTLSANTYYQLSVYAKTVGTTTASIFLTGESSASTGQNYFLIEPQDNISNGEWKKYTFFIEVGNTSVSVKLNLWLGQNVDYMTVAGDTDDEKKENAKSAGAVFFDNVSYKTIEESEYIEATDKDEKTNKKISFLTDSFDSLSDDVTSRGKLSTPNGWTGAAESGLSSSNSKVGIVYADDQYYDTENVDGRDYSRLLGLDYKAEDIEITDKDISDARESGKYQDKTDDEIVEELRAQKLIDQKKENWIPVNELTAHSGTRMLVINNTANSAYTYTSASNTLKANSFYEISVFVKTYGLSGRDGDDTIGANIELYLGSVNDSNKPLIFKGKQTQKKDDDGNVVSNEWTEYKFYVKTLDDDVTSVTLKLSLGSSSTEDIDGNSVTSGLTKGYAMFDDVCIKKLDDSEMDDTKFENIETNANTIPYTVPSDTKGTSSGGDDNTNTETPNNKFNLDYLWWMIPTIVIGLVIIVVVVVLVVRKLRKPGVKKAIKQASAPTNSEMLDKKHNKYDEGKE